MAVSKHQGKWRAEVWFQGKRVWSQSGFETELEAKNAEAEAKENLEAINMDFLKLCEARLDEVQLKRSHSHYRENKMLLKKLVESWGDKRKVIKIDRDAIEQYLNDVAKESKSKANKHLRLIRALFNHAVKRNWIKNNPAAGIDRFPETPGKRYVPSEEDINKVLDLAKPMDRLYLLVVAHTLGRVRAVNNLKWEDIHDNYVSLYTRKARNSDLKEIRVPMNEVLREVLTHIPRISEYVFPNEQTGKPFDYRDKFLPTLCKKAGVRPFMYHALRHFGASKLDEQGTPLTVIQEILGHERATTTDIYLRSLRGGKLEAMKKLETVFTHKPHA
jgi:integrase